MIKKNKHSKIIANYLYNDMSREEEAQFEKDLLVDEELASEYELQSAATKYLKARITLEEMMSDPDLAEAEKLAEEMFNEEDDAITTESRTLKIRPNKRKVVTRILAAAVVIIGIVSTTLIISNGTNQSLYKSFYDPFDETYLSYRGGNEDLNEKLVEGIRLYTKEDYTKSLIVFQDIYSENHDNPLSSFYLALSYMGAEKNDKAVDQFEVHMSSFEVYNPEVKWYLSLCYLKADKNHEAYELLQDLSSYPGKYGESSRKLAKKLERKFKDNI